MSTPQRVLLTGATGHVGGRLFRHLISETDIVVRAVFRSPQSMPAWATRAEVIHGDLSDATVRKQALLNIDTVIHLATRGFSAVAAPSQVELDSERAIAHALALESVAMGVSRYLFVSSIHVYGSALSGRVDDTTPASPSTAYGASRLQIEDDLIAATEGTRTTANVIRLTNSFGAPAFPRQETWNLLIHDLCRQAVEHSRISLRSDVRTRRDTMALRDVATVVTQLISSANFPAGRFLLASGLTMQLSEIAELVQRQARVALGNDIPIESHSNNDPAPVSFTFEPRKLRALGTVIPDNRDIEIRDLLTLAQREFGKLT